MRLVDQPEPYAVVVLMPKDGPGQDAVTQTVNGRVAKLIAWLLDHRHQIETMRGALAFNLGPSSFQAEIRETFPHQNVVRSAVTGRVVEASSTETFAEEAASPSEQREEHSP